MAYFVSEGKSITSKRGIRGPHDDLTEKDLAGGKDALVAFVKSGHLYEAAKSKPAAAAEKAEKERAAKAKKAQSEDKK